MYHENHKINDMVLTIINDGNGSQCGMDYAARCAGASKKSFMNACVQYMPNASHHEISVAADLLKAYYIEHVQEMTA